MWNPFVVDDCNYLIKCIETPNVKIQVTDFKKIWVENTTVNDLVTRFEELNPLFDSTSLSSEDIFKKLTSLLKEIHVETTIKLTQENNQITLELKRKLPECSIRCKFCLCLGDEDMFFNELTIPLVQSVQYLEVRQKKLFDLLEKKDKEIQQHQLESGEISRKSLVTKKFDKNALLAGAPEKLFVNVFGKSKTFLDAFTKKYGTIANTSPKKTENAESKPRKKLKVETPTS